MNFRQGLYQEAVYISSKRNAENSADSMDDFPVRRAKHERSKSLSQSEFSSLTSISRIQPSLMRSTSSRKLCQSDPIMDRLANTPSRTMTGKSALKKLNSPPPPIPEEIRGKENCSSGNSAKDGHCLKRNSPKSTTPVKRTPVKKDSSSESPPGSVKLQVLRMGILQDLH